MLLEKYLQAAEAIVAEAVPTAARVVPQQTVGGNRFRSPDGPARGDRLTFYEPALVSHGVGLERAGRYRMIVNLDVFGHFDFDPGRAMVVLRLNGKNGCGRSSAGTITGGSSSSLRKPWNQVVRSWRWNCHPWCRWKRNART
jgi:hypothetical protein